MRNIVCAVFVLSALVFCACGDGEHLSVEPVETPEGAGEDVPGETHDLFRLKPGEKVLLSSLGGAVDPVGTTIVQDFDGDGIANDRETTSNAWVADYPVVETDIAPPVTMRIEVLYSSGTRTKEYSTDITSSDTTSNMEYSMESVHRNEVNLRTAQYQDSYTASSSKSKSKSRSAGGGVKIGGCGGSLSGGSSVSRAYSQSFGETKTKWQDVPFKNNLNRQGWSLKRDEASKNARQMRRDVRTETDSSYEIKPSAGYIRAALYITNLSVNLPVKLRDILCSFMLEAPDGQLLPVQSFRLRNDDYSIFEIELYGDTTFGPYVIELKNLNTNEIMEAINKGYNPKIYIVDYEMSHVEDSNYRRALSSSFTGDNLKIIEENSKGRTAGVRIVAPNRREFFRVAAFETDGAESRTGSNGAVYASPGVSIEKVIRRISYSGLEAEFANYVIDFSGIEPEMRIKKPDGTCYDGPRFHVRTLKSLGGVENKLPVSKIITEPDGSKTYVMKPLSGWSDDDYDDFKMWVLFDKGRYYLHSADMKEDGLQKEYVYLDHQGVRRTVPMVTGISNTVWPGDHYDLVYFDLAEHLGLREEFGNNPIETNERISFNTRWNSGELGDYPFYPDVMSRYLGEVGLGDTVELEIKLEATHYLDPSFGQAVKIDNVQYYTDFRYDWRKCAGKFSYDEAIDFELSYGLGGNHGDWVNLNTERSEPYSRYTDKIEVLNKSWDFLNQEFTVTIRVPLDLEGVDEDDPVKLYLRPALSNAYRESLWPLSSTQVKKFRGTLAATVPKGGTLIKVAYPAGTAMPGDTVTLLGGEGTANSYLVVSAGLQEDRLYAITLSAPMMEDHRRGEQVFVNLPTEAGTGEQALTMCIDDGFFDAWGAEYAAVPPDNLFGYVPLMVGNGETASPASYLGFAMDYIAGNWIGGNNFSHPAWNNWADAKFYANFLDRIFDPFLQTSSLRALRLTVPFATMAGGDFLVNTTAANNQENVRVAITDDVAVIVWHSNDSGNFDIRCRVIDVRTGLAAGNDLAVNRTTANDQVCPQVAVAGKKALVVWHTTTPGSAGNGVDVRYRVIDLDNLDAERATGTDYSVGTSAIYRQAPRVAVLGNRVLIVWSGYFSAPYYWDIYGLVIDIGNGSSVGAPFNVCSNYASYQLNTSVAIGSGAALVVWQSNHVASSYDIWGRTVDILSSTPQVTGPSDIQISTTNANNQEMPRAAAWGDRACVVWQSGEGGVNNNVYGRLVDMASGVVLGTGDFPVSTSNLNDQKNAQAALCDGKAIVVWESSNNVYGYDIRGRFVDIGLLSPEGAGDFLLSTTYGYDQLNPQVAIAGNRALVVWQSRDPGSHNDIRYRVVDMNSSIPLGTTDFLVSTANSYDQLSPHLAAIEDRACVGWQSRDNGANYDIRARRMEGLNVNNGHSLPHGLNNFMVSPLVERDYSVTMSIKE